MSRLSELRVADLDEGQAALYRIVKRPPREFVQGPIRALMLSQTLGEQIQRLGAAVHRGTVLGQRLEELAVLTVARSWSCRYVWSVHAPLAVEHGISPDVVEAIRRRAEPSFDREDEAAVYAYSQALVNAHHVPDDVYGLARSIFGETGVADLTGLLGYFVMLAMMVNGFELEAPDGEKDRPGMRLDQP